MLAHPTRQATWWFTPEQRSMLLLLVSLITLALPLLLVPARRPAKPAVLPAAAELTLAPPPALSVAQSGAPDATRHIPPTLATRPELVEQRTAYSASFAMDDGTFAVLQNSQPLHFRDATGAWQPIDPTLAEMEGGWASTANALRLSVAQQRGSANIGVGDTRVGWQPDTLMFVDQAGNERRLATPLADAKADSGERSADGLRVRYPSSWSNPAIQEQWVGGRGEAEYLMRIESRPVPPPAGAEFLDLQVRLHLPPGTTMQSGMGPMPLPTVTNRPLTFAGPSGEALHLNPPAVYEQGNTLRRADGVYTLAATDKPGEIELRVRFPWAWLAAPERSYPVVIDPLFYVTSPIVARDAFHNTLPEAWPLLKGARRTSFAGYGELNASPYRLGMFDGKSYSALVRFNLPSLPAGSEIERGYFFIRPTAAGPGSRLNRRDVLPFPSKAAEAVAAPLSNRDWERASTTDTTIVPVPENALNPARGNQAIIAQLDTLPVAAAWEITDLARKWKEEADLGFIPPDYKLKNNGVVIDVNPPNYACNADYINCGAFLIEPPTDWDADDLARAQSNDTPDDPSQPFAFFQPEGGFRLVIFYRGPSLTNNVIAKPPARDPNIFQEGGEWPSVTGNIYAAHDYTLPALPAGKWRAVVVRGFGAEVSLANGGGTRNEKHIPLTGVFSPMLRLNDDSGPVPNVLFRQGEATKLLNPPYQGAPESGTVSYHIFDGERDANKMYRLRVPPPEQGQPVSYEARLVDEQPEQLNNDTGPLPPEGRTYTTTTSLNFSSADPLALWNVRLPPGSISRVIVFVNGRRFADGGFEGHLLDAASGNAIKLVDNGNTALSSPIFTAAGRYALALSYSGPESTYEPVIGPRRIDPDLLTQQGLDIESERFQATGRFPNPHTFTLSVRIISCGQIDGFPSFPTPTGSCQVVKCPAIPQALPPDPASPFRTVAGLGLWSESGWTSSGSNTTGPAPLIGAADPYISPSVAVLGTPVTINGESVTINETSSGAQASFLLVRCPTLSTTPQPPEQFFEIHQGSGASGARRIDNQDVAILALRLSETSPLDLVNPWHNSDRRDLIDFEQFLVPQDGMFRGQAILTRVLTNGDLTTHRFNIAWQLTVEGWPSLKGSISPPDVGVTTVASLNLAMGDSFRLDIGTSCKDGLDAGGRFAQRTFCAIRASRATITQSASLGGASKDVQAVITSGLGFGGPQLDLRGPADSFARPDPTWRMPDVFIGGEARTLAFGGPGVLEVYSADHPLAANDSGVDFSYESFGAKVSIKQEKCSETDAADVTVIRGETQLSLPSIGDSGSPSDGITAKFKLCETSLREVKITFASTTGIPIGNSGLVLKSIEGTVDIAPGEGTKIEVKIEFETAGSTGLVKMSGSVLIDTRGLFQFKGEGGLLKGVVGAKGELWVAWSPLDIGFSLMLEYPRKDKWLTGAIRAHMWRGQGWQNRYSWLPDNDDFHLAAQFQAKIEIKEGAIADWWLLELPPSDIELEIEVAFGQFCTNNACTSYEWGVKGKFSVLGHDVGLYYGFDHGISFILGNDDHVLIDQYGGAKPSPVEGELATNLEETVRVLAAPEADDGVALIPVNVSQRAESLLFGLGWQAGSPRLTLVAPDGTEVTPENAVQHGAEFSGTLTSALVGLRDPAPGLWSAKISGLSPDGIEHYKFIFLANKGGPIKPGANPFIAPAAADEPGTGGYTLRWRVPVGTPETARIALYYSRTVTETGNLDDGVPIVQHLPLTAGSYTWDTAGVGNGSYRVYAVVDDGINTLDSTKLNDPDDSCTLRGELPPAHSFRTDRFPGTSVFTATGTILIADTTPPASPTGLALAGSDDALLARWTLGAERDIAAYVVRWGPRVGESFTPQFARRIVAIEEPALRLGGLRAGVEYGVTVAALDVSDNVSPATAVQFAAPDAAEPSMPQAPSKPVVSVLSSTSARVNWTPGEGVLPAGFQLIYTRLGEVPETSTLDATANSVILDSLQTGATYELRVVARSASGWKSAASDSITSTISVGPLAEGELPADWASAYGVSDPAADSDNDGLTNLQEYRASSDPTRQDSDGDLLSDYEEVQAGSNPIGDSATPAALLQPRLDLETDKVSLKFKLQSGQPAPRQQVAWINSGAGTLILEAQTDQSWLQARVLSNTVEIRLDHERMEPGYHTGLVRLVPGLGSDPLIGPQSCIRVEAWASPPDSGFVYKRFLPVVTGRDAPPLTAPDLVGTLSVVPSRKTFAAGEPVEVVATITNRGNAPSSSFWVDLYINPDGAPSGPNRRWNEACGINPCFGIAWDVQRSLAPGESITLTSALGNYDAGQSVWPGWFASGTTDLYLYVDSWNPGVTYGSIREQNEVNNRAELRGLNVSGRNPSAALHGARLLPPR